MLLDIYVEIFKSDAITLKNLNDLAERLSKVAGHEPPWTGRYLNSILKGHKGFKMTKELDEAVVQLGMVLDGQSIIQAKLRPIQAYSINGNTPDGVIILGDSKRCDLGSCQVLFVKKSGNQRFCCEAHRLKYWEEKRADGH